MRTTKKFVYLISPNKILSNNFYKILEKLLKTKKISFFQLRLKNQSKQKILNIAKKVIKITKKHNVKFIINDSPYIARQVGSDGCHIGQKDFNIKKARKILKNKILGVTCHNSIKLVRYAIEQGADYVALGSFFPTKTKKTKFRIDFKTLRRARKFAKKPIVAIGGINYKNYKKVLLNKANFLAISSYIWKNKKYKPLQAIERLK